MTGDAEALSARPDFDETIAIVFRREEQGEELCVATRQYPCTGTAKPLLHNRPRHRIVITSASTGKVQLTKKSEGQ
jgi:hypothetical protein